MISRAKSISCTALLATGLAAFLVPPAGAQTLRIAMTSADLPTVTGIPNNGGVIGPICHC